MSSGGGPFKTTGWGLFLPWERRRLRKLTQELEDEEALDEDFEEASVQQPATTVVLPASVDVENSDQQPVVASDSDSSPLDTLTEAIRHAGGIADPAVAAVLRATTADTAPSRAQGAEVEPVRETDPLIPSEAYSGADGAVSAKDHAAAEIVNYEGVRPEWLNLGIVYGVDQEPSRHAEFRMVRNAVFRLVDLIQALSNTESIHWARFRDLAAGLSYTMGLVELGENSSQAAKLSDQLVELRTSLRPVLASLPYDERIRLLREAFRRARTPSDASSSELGSPRASRAPADTQATESIERTSETA